MHKKLSFWIAVAVAIGLWLSTTWMLQVQATEGGTAQPCAVQDKAPQQQSCAQCAQRPDLQIKSIRLEPDPPGVNKSYNVYVELVNACAGNNLADSWAHLYINRAPTGDPDLQAFAQTSQLEPDRGNTVQASFTITSGNATAGWHTISVTIDARNDIPNEACNGEDNNEGAISFEIETVYPTDTPQPTATPYPAPEIHIFTPEEATVAIGDALDLKWQVNGQAVSVYLDGELMPMVHTHTIYPTESQVFTLRAENPGGAVQKTSRITVVEPTETPTLTPTPCDFPIIHEFGASPSSVVRGERVTIFWDVSGAKEVYLNGDGVDGVSSKTKKLDQTTTFVLMARNICGEIEETLTVQARYATPTPSLTPTITRTPTRTPTMTYTPSVPTSTPTRNVLPTPTRTATLAPGQTPEPTPTRTATATSAFNSPIGTPTATPPGAGATPTTALTPTTAVTGTPDESTATTTPTHTATATFTATPTATILVPPTRTATHTPPPRIVVVDVTATWTPTMPPATATASPTPEASATVARVGGSIRAYLCPLTILLVFAIGVLVLSIVMPRLQERRQGFETFQHAVAAYGGVAESEGRGSSYSNPAPLDADDTVFAPDEPLTAKGPQRDESALDSAAQDPSTAEEAT
jgi:hypothetical protein